MAPSETRGLKQHQTGREEEGEGGEVKEMPNLTKDMILEDERLDGERDGEE